ncbi:MAG TPA: hypothetical protein GXZ60_03415 [Intrasporangiaceae bacterium]|nr:hypothetical protein [Intrasporangiaceae bacterium]
MKRLTQSLPYLAAAIVGYFVPAALTPLGAFGSGDGKAIAFSSLLLINPIVTAAAAALLTRRHGVTWWFPVLTAAAFLPIALIPPLNDSAFVYAGLYLVTGALGTGLGWLLRTWGRKPADPAPTADPAPSITTN